ncbi:MAG: hypothetical protein QOK17_2919 [Sphingomonadales bacterium]|nr:hypothetical protein [Sphingomonadales bacterium]
MRLVLPKAPPYSGLLPAPPRVTLDRDLARLRIPRVNGRLPPAVDALDYLMACFSQIAYVPTAHEAANRRRTKVVPSSLFEEMSAAGRAADVAALIRQAFRDAGETLVRRVATANSVTTLTRLAGVVVIASRGTRLFHSFLRPSRDLLIDLDALPVAWGSPDTRYHFGFLEEACASIPAVRSAYEEIGKGLPIFFTGHSLGGALSTVTDRLWGEAWPADERSTIVFGCPRFGNARAAGRLPCRALVRPWDPVPGVPVGFGYADPIMVFRLPAPAPRAWVRLWRNHSMEGYRRAVAIREKRASEDESLFRRFATAIAP